jgi:hypothetical protein
VTDKRAQVGYQQTDKWTLAGRVPMQNRSESKRVFEKEEFSLLFRAVCVDLRI